MVSRPNVERNTMECAVMRGGKMEVSEREKIGIPKRRSKKEEDRKAGNFKNLGSITTSDEVM